MEEDNQVTSHKGEKIRNYPLQFKLDAISFAQIPMEIDPQKESSKLIGKEYENAQSKKKVLKKL